MQHSDSPTEQKQDPASAELISVKLVTDCFLIYAVHALIAGKKQNKKTIKIENIKKYQIFSTTNWQI